MRITKKAVVLFIASIVVLVFGDLQNVYAKSKRTKLAKVKTTKKAKLANKHRVAKKQTQKVKRSPVIFNRSMWQYTPRSLRIKYAKVLRSSVLALHKEFSRKHKNDYRPSADLMNKLELFYQMIQDEAFASTPEVGQPCLYAGWPSTYQQYPGWGRPYCVPSNGNGQGVGPDEQPYNGGKCAEGQILCNPALFGMGRSGNGYCTHRGNGSFNSCQNQYYNDRGYPASAIAQQLADGELGYQAVQGMREFVEDFCSDGNRQSRQCRAIIKRLDKLDTEWTRLELPRTTTAEVVEEEVAEDTDEVVADDGEIATDTDEDLVDTEIAPEPGDLTPGEDVAGTDPAGGSDVCAPRPYDRFPGAEGGEALSIGSATCLQCMLDMEMDANSAVADRGTPKSRVSQRYLQLASTVSKACAPDVPADMYRVNGSVLRVLGACSEADYNFDQQEGAVFSRLQSELQSYVNGQSAPNAIRNNYGMTEEEFKAAFCVTSGEAADGLVRPSQEVIEAIKNTGRSGDYGIRGLEYRDQMVSCLEAARARESSMPNRCTMTQFSDDMDLYTKAGAEISEGRPVVVNMGAGRACATMNASPPAAEGEAARILGYLPNGESAELISYMGKSAKDSEGRRIISASSSAPDEGIAVRPIREGRFTRAWATGITDYQAGARVTCTGAAFNGNSLTTTPRANEN